MAAFGYPGVFPGGLTTGYLITGAVQKQTTGDLGYPGVFPGGLTTGYLNIGAVKKEVVVGGGVSIPVLTQNMRGGYGYTSGGFING